MFKTITFILGFASFLFCTKIEDKNISPKIQIQIQLEYTTLPELSLKLDIKDSNSLDFIIIEDYNNPQAYFTTLSQKTKLENLDSTLIEDALEQVRANSKGILSDDLLETLCGLVIVKQGNKLFFAFSNKEYLDQLSHLKERLRHQVPGLKKREEIDNGIQVLEERIIEEEFKTPEISSERSAEKIYDQEKEKSENEEPLESSRSRQLEVMEAQDVQNEESSEEEIYPRNVVQPKAKANAKTNAQKRKEKRKRQQEERKRQQEERKEDQPSMELVSEEQNPCLHREKQETQSQETYEKGSYVLAELLKQHNGHELLKFINQKVEEIHSQIKSAFINKHYDGLKKLVNQKEELFKIRKKYLENSFKSAVAEESTYPITPEDVKQPKEQSTASSSGLKGETEQTTKKPIENEDGLETKVKEQFLDNLIKLEEIEKNKLAEIEKNLSDLEKQKTKIIDLIGSTITEESSQEERDSFDQLLRPVLDKIEKLKQEKEKLEIEKASLESSNKSLITTLNQLKAEKKADEARFVDVEQLSKNKLLKFF